MKKKLLSVLAACALSISLAGCSDPGSLQVIDEQQLQGESGKFIALDEQVLTWSNLADRPARDQIRKALVEAGLTAPRITHLMENVKEFNKVVLFQDLVPSGFKTQKGIADYSKLIAEQKWNTKYPAFSGYNSRIASFIAMADLITIGFDNTFDDAELFEDKEAIDNDPSKLITEQELTKFSVLFSKIPLPASVDSNAGDLKALEKAVTQFREKNNLVFNDSVNASMIQVFKYEAAGTGHKDNENSNASNTPPQADAQAGQPQTEPKALLLDQAAQETSQQSAVQQEKQPENSTAGNPGLFPVHAGIWALDGAGGYLFLEKLSFQEPYQLLRFASRAQLYQYLMAKYGETKGSDTNRPIIFENNDPFDPKKID